MNDAPANAFDKPLRAALVWHASVVIVLGLAAGIPFALVITGDLGGDLRAWRMAHLEGVLNGLLMLGAAGAGNLVLLRASEARWLLRCLLLTGYGNAFGAIIGAAAGARGLQPGASVAELAVFLLFGIAIVAVLAALLLVACGARRCARMAASG